VWRNVDGPGSRVGLNVHLRIVADCSLRYAVNDPTFVEQSAWTVLHRDRGDDQGLELLLVAVPIVPMYAYVCPGSCFGSPRALTYL